MRVWIWLLAAGCGGDSTTASDAVIAGDSRSDATRVTETRVTGSLYGSPFTLRYASIQRASAMNAFNWLCVADIPVTYEQCSMTGGSERVIFLGPFIYDNGAPKWSIPQVWLYHIGTSFSKYATTATLQIYVDDATTGELQLTLDADFEEAQHTTGSVLIPGT